MGYVLHVWGGFFQNEQVKKYPELLKNWYFFDTELEAEKKFGELSETRNIFEGNTGLVHSVSPYKKGTGSTFVKMNLVYNGVEYSHLDDCGFGYTEEDIKFMYYDGNYSCDCNKSIFINREHGNIINELECGDKIKIKDFEVFYKNTEID